MNDISGHACPKCGCRDTRPIGASTFFGVTTRRLQCRHCAATFSEPPPEDAPPVADAGPEIAYTGDPARCFCPKCEEKNPKVRSTQRRGSQIVRYHLCKCGHRFRSIEG